MNGVIETSSGKLLRAGYCDFENDGSFNPETESIRTDVPESPLLWRLDVSSYHRWTGSEWEVATQTPEEETVTTKIDARVWGPYDTDHQYYSKGNGDAPYQCLANTTNIFDMEITSDDVGADNTCLLIGGEYWTDENVQKGDYVEFSVVDKNDVLGYFQLYGLTVGVDVLELSKYVRKRPVRTNEYQKIRPGTTATVYLGLFLRLTYVAVNLGNTRECRIAMELAK